jgi:hypothetical protein
MKYLMIITLAALSACASTPEEPPADVLAIQDYIAVAELTEVDKMENSRDAGMEKLGNKRYILLKARRQTYLVEFGRDCWQLYDNTRLATDPLSWDQRNDANYLRPRMDTIRGCRIGRAFEVNEGQIEEIRNLGEAPTGG